MTIAVVAASAMVWPAASLAAAHPAARSAVNLIRDPGAERVKPDSAGGKVKVPGWIRAKGSQFTAVKYGAAGGFPAATSPGQARGKNFFAGGPSGSTSGAARTDSLKPDAKLIRSGRARFTLSAWLGG